MATGECLPPRHPEWRKLMKHINPEALEYLTTILSYSFINPSHTYNSPLPPASTSILPQAHVLWRPKVVSLENSWQGETHQELLLTLPAEDCCTLSFQYTSGIWTTEYWNIDVWSHLWSQSQSWGQANTEIHVHFVYLFFIMIFFPKGKILQKLTSSCRDQFTFSPKMIFPVG